MFEKIRLSRWLAGAVVLAAAECASLAAVEFALTGPAQAQFFDNRGPFQSRQRPQRSGGFFDNLFGPSDRRGYENVPERREQHESSDSSRAPSPRKTDKGDTPPTTSIVVMGDAMADWLAYGLEDAFADAPEVGIVRKNKPYSGLLRYEAKGDLDWWHVARDLLAQEKPSYVIMMLGLNDRQNIRERDLAKEADKKEADRKKAKDQQDKPDAAKTDAAKTDAKTDADKAAPNKDSVVDKESDDPDQPSIVAPEPQGKRASGTLEFRSDKWETIYSRRIDETIAALKSKGVPVFWVGLPSIRGTRSTADVVYLNDLYRARAERAGAVYIDVWDGFVDEGGKFTSFGPDFEGQGRRLRAGDGVYFTKYGARKLAHYVERELRRFMSNRSLQISLPSGPVGPQPADGKSAARPLAGPVVPLTTTPGNSDELLGGPGSRAAQGDAIATSVLVKGEPVAAAPGRADDFVWPRGSDANANADPAAAATAPPPAAAKTQGGPQGGDAAKTAPNNAAKTRQQRVEESRPRAPQNNAPRPPRPPSSLGWLR